MLLVCARYILGHSLYMQDAEVPFLPAGTTEEARHLGWPCVAGRLPAPQRRCFNQWKRRRGNKKEMIESPKPRAKSVMITGKNMMTSDLGEIFDTVS